MQGSAPAIEMGRCTHCLWLTDAKRKMQRVTKAYVDTFKSVILKITPKHITTFDYTKDEAWNNFMKTYLQK